MLPGVSVLVVRAPDATAALRGLVARHRGTTPDSVHVSRAACPSCGGPHGRPVVGAGPDVSLARSGPVVAVALSDDGPVGIDVEEVARTAFAGFPAVALHADERRAVEAGGLEARARTWVRKEAALKAAGVGLVVDPTTVVVTAPDAPAGLVRWPRRPPRLLRSALPLPAPADVALADVPAPDGWVACVGALRPSGGAGRAASAGAATP
ncbi:MAG: 4'-phosphopantetheinyl transferase family protein [Kineosporiaceae bacterium]